MPRGWPHEAQWLRAQPPAVLVAYLDAVTHLDMPPSEFLALQAWVLARLAANGRA
jgi:hypothetical protein